jgi:tetratricopeptide (TPR) repeat protein
VPIDRAATLRNAEKFLRQGKLDAAIGEYLRVVDDQPRDWNTANTLGDLYVRAGHTDKAVEQFIRIADSLNEQGFLPKAGALYKKILKLKPEHEHALLQAADIAASQGLLADARSYLKAVADRRTGRNDTRGVAQIQIRLASLDSDDYAARLVGADARKRIGDLAGAIDDFKTIAAELAEKGRSEDAVAALREAAALAPDDETVRASLLAIYIRAADFAGARACATTADQFRTLSGALEAAGHDVEALDALCDASRLAPDDRELQAHLARAFVARGDLPRAAEYLTVDAAGSDPQLLQTVAEIQLRGGNTAEGLAVVRRVLEDDPSRREQIALLGWTIAEQAPDAGFGVVEIAADAAVAAEDWASAAAGLQEFVTRVPNHIPALMRLVEICVDGGLEATMYSAQAHLADAYIAAGSASEALVIAEDLVAREPWDRANVERFRRALALMGEGDPDAIIAERLSGQSPFTSTDLSLSELPAFDEAAASAESAVHPDPVDEPAADERLRIEAPAQADAPAAPQPPSPMAARRAAQFELSANAIDLDSILGEPPASTPTAHARSESVEVDLSIVLGDMKAAGGGGPIPRGESDNLDGVFAHLRDEAARRSAVEAAEQSYQRGLAMQQAGDIDGAIDALTAASRAPKLRFQTASVLGRIFRSRGDDAQAIDWFERAAQAPAPTPDDSHALLYELAELLEAAGETARALALCMELHAEAGEYRDVSARVDRLAKVQSRG